MEAKGSPSPCFTKHTMPSHRRSSALIFTSFSLRRGLAARLPKHPFFNGNGGLTSGGSDR